MVPGKRDFWARSVVRGTLGVKTLLSIQLSRFGVQREWGMPLSPNSLDAIPGSDNLPQMQDSCVLSHCIICWSPSHIGCLSITWALERQPPPQWSSCVYCSNLIRFSCNRFCATMVIALNLNEIFFLLMVSAQAACPGLLPTCTISVSRWHLLPCSLHLPFSVPWTLWGFASLQISAQAHRSLNASLSFSLV